MHRKRVAIENTIVFIGAGFLGYLQNRTFSVSVGAVSIFLRAPASSEILSDTGIDAEGSARFASPADEFGGQTDELVTQCLNRCSKFFRWQTKSFEPMHEVVR